MLATTPRLTASSSRARYFAGVSSSARSGMAIGSRIRCSEFDFELFDTGVPGPGELWRGKEGSEFCLSRCVMLNSPKLFRPIVDVEVREEGNGGVGRATSSGASFTDPTVEDLFRRPRRAGGT